MSEIQKLRKSLDANVAVFDSKVESFYNAFNAVPKNKRTIGSRYKAVIEEEINCSNVYKQLIMLDTSVSDVEDVASISYKRIRKSFESVEDSYNTYLDTLEEISKDKDNLLQNKSVQGKLSILGPVIFISKFYYIVIYFC